MNRLLNLIKVAMCTLIHTQSIDKRCYRDSFIFLCILLVGFWLTELWTKSQPLCILNLFFWMTAMKLVLAWMDSFKLIWYFYFLKEMFQLSSKHEWNFFNKKFKLNTRNFTLWFRVWLQSILVEEISLTNAIKLI